MLVGFAVLLPLGRRPGLGLVGAAALVLVGWAGARGLVRPRDVARAAHPSFALLVLALGVAVAAVATGFLGDLVARLVPERHVVPGPAGRWPCWRPCSRRCSPTSPPRSCWCPLVAPLGTTAVLAALLGLNIGSGLTWTGSLANLLWRRTLARSGRPVSSAAFHRVSLAITPASLFLGVGTARRCCAR